MANSDSLLLNQASIDRFFSCHQNNVGATKLSSNLVFHSRMKHVAVDYHFLHDQVQSGAFCVTHVSSANQLVDLLTKPLPSSQFQNLRDKIGLSTRGLS
ncbi:hypothetical protein Pint_03325 [Pistacia integerrima]|uniref:Uncharacterized protein n=1 Tax=Pistacia integerrima TaxID=434235 RepID=A0ACC0ZGV6_9ROSI|nr:hypothetical protein Pint_03325 [Pistacia integerrima]